MRLSVGIFAEVMRTLMGGPLPVNVEPYDRPPKAIDIEALTVRSMRPKQLRIGARRSMRRSNRIAFGKYTLR